MAGLPEWLEPMAATLTQERFTGPEWLFEQKLDGIRMLAFKDGRDVRLLSRNRLPQNGSYPSVAAAIAGLPVRDAILDGEATGVWGRQGKVAYHVFDVLWLDGRDLTPLPLEQRRSLLGRLPLAAPLERVPEVLDEKPWERASQEGWEGVIAKRRDAPYEHRRSPHWLKMKCEATQELVIGGFTDPQGSRVGTGLDTKLLLDLRARLDALEIAEPTFTKAVGLPRVRAHWVRPELVVQVAFTEWTVHGKLRHPRLLGLRTDKPARDVVRES